jgi:hypothetical protein
VAALEVPFDKGTLKIAEGLELWPALREELQSFRRKQNPKTATSPSSTGATRTTTTSSWPWRWPAGARPPKAQAHHAGDSVRAGRIAPRLNECNGKDADRFGEEERRRALT